MDLTAASLHLENQLARDHCAYCGPCSGQIFTLLCGRCNTANYCSKKCQRAHWKKGGHREECDRIVASRDAGKEGALSPAIESIGSSPSHSTIEGQASTASAGLMETIASLEKELVASKSREKAATSARDQHHLDLLAKIQEARKAREAAAAASAELAEVMASSEGLPEEVASLRAALGSCMATIREQEAAVSGSSRERDAASRKAMLEAEARVRAQVTTELETKWQERLRVAEDAAKTAAYAGTEAAATTHEEAQFQEQAHNRAINALEAQLARAEARVNAEASAAADAAAAWEAEKRELERALATAAAEESTRLQEVEDAHALALVTMRREGAAALAQAKAACDSQLAQQQTDFAATTSELAKGHTAVLDACRDAHAAALAELQASHTAEISALKEAAKVPVEAMEAAHQAELQKALAAAEADHATSSSVWQAAYESETAERQASHEAALKEAQKALGTAVLEAKEAAAVNLAAAEARFKDQLADQVLSFAAQAEAAAAERAAEVADLKAKHAAAVQVLEEKIKGSEKGTARAKSDLVLAQLSQEAAGKAHQKALTLAAEVAALEVDTEKKNHASELESIRVEVEEERARHAAELTKCREDAAADKEAALSALAASLKSAIEEAQRLQHKAQGMYLAERKHHAALHERVMELQGNIRVFARCRPLVPVDTSPPNGKGSNGASAPSSAVSVMALHPESLIDTGVGEEIQVRDARTGYDRGGLLRFEFDACFGPAATQEQVFEQMRPLVTSFMDGYNVCIFAYGQTGSGKTYTMEGAKDASRGVNFRTLVEAFAVAEERAGAGLSVESFQFSVEYLEVYQEHVRDLLADSDHGSSSSSSEDHKRSSLEVRQTKAGYVYAEGLTSVRLHCPEDLEDLLARGARRRAVGSHSLNTHSSRSHAILTLTCETIAGPGRSPCLSRLHLVDLAGSERVAKTDASGEQLKEANAINKSLAALGDVIQALGTKKGSDHHKPTNAASSSSSSTSSSKSHGHVPFRNSKLTYLLQNSLTGASKVLMICCAAPTENHASETICSLNFAGRCRAVQLGTAHKTDKCKRLEERILDLETQLRDKENDASSTVSHSLVGVKQGKGKSSSTGSSASATTRRHALS